MTIDHVYNESDCSNIYKMYKEACSFQCIDDLIKSFYESHSWIIVIQGFSHIIDTLVTNIHQLVLIESDHGMLTWLQGWKQ